MDALREVYETQVPRYWRVIGAADVGGILARVERSTKSPSLGRLPVGTIVQELEQAGDRIRFRIVYQNVGGGPSSGWVSLHSGRGTELLEPCEYEPPEEDVEEVEKLGAFSSALEAQQPSSSSAAEAMDSDSFAKAAEASPDVTTGPTAERPEARWSTAPAGESSLILPGPAALEAWFDELAKRAEAYRPFMPASNLAHNSVPSMFLVFTSMSGLLGLSRQWEYASSNSFLDSLMHFRHKQALSGREMHIGNVNSVGMGAMAGDGVGVSPAEYGQIFTHIISHAEHPGADIFETPVAFPQMGQNLGLTLPYLRAYDAKYAKMAAALQAQAEKVDGEVEEDTSLAKREDAAPQKMTLAELQKDPEMIEFIYNMKSYGREPDAAKHGALLKKFAQLIE